MIGKLVRKEYAKSPPNFPLERGKRMQTFKRSIAAVITAAGVMAGGVAIAPAASAAPMVTIYPNYSDAHCKGGWVRAVQVSAFPGNTNVYRNGRWAPVQAPRGQRVKIVANIWCASWWNRNGAAFKVAQNHVTVVANKSYYF